MPTARASFPRSSVTGNIPAEIEPGSFAMNWPDRKLYIGGPDGTPIQVAQPAREWSPGLQYRAGDLALRDGDLHRAIGSPEKGQFIPEQWSALTTNKIARLGDPSATGLVEGGMLGIDVATGRLTVAAGSGIVVGGGDPASMTYEEVAWDAFSAPPPADGWHVVFVNSSGVLTYSDNASASARRAAIALGMLNVESGAISGLVPYAALAYQTAESYRDEYSAVGGAFRLGGCVVTPVPQSRQLNMTAGLAFSLGASFRVTPNSPNTLGIAAQTPMIFDRIVGSGQVTDTGRTLLDPDFYNPSGSTLEAVPGGKFTIQYLLVKPLGVDAWAVYGQRVYDTEAEALNAVDTDWGLLTLPEIIKTPAVPVAAVVLEQGSVTLNDAPVISAEVKARPPFRAPASLSGGTFDDSALYRLNGSRALTNDMDAGGYQITNVDLTGGTF